jgi:hypothetical protein
MKKFLTLPLLLIFFISVKAQTNAQLLAAASAFPAMPRGTADLFPFVGSLPTFASGTPYSDLEFTLYDTDYMDGENNGHDTFMPVDPSDSFPGSNKVKYIRCALNTDLNASYGGASGDRIILGTAENQNPFFLKGLDNVDNDYVVIQHFDYTNGYIQLKGQASDYALNYFSTTQGVATEGYYLFYTKNAVIDLIAFIFPCNVLEPGISGNSPNNLTALCNPTGQLNLNSPNHFKYALPISTTASLPTGLFQFGSKGKEIVTGITVDSLGYIYMYGLTDGNLDRNTDAANEIFVAKYNPNGTKVWVTELATKEGTLLIDAVTDGQFIYACGRTLGNIPGFANAGKWDGIILKINLITGQIVTSKQWGNSGIDGFGNIVLDDAGNLFVSGQGSAAGGGGGTDKVYLVAKYNASTLNNIWTALDSAATSGFSVSAEAWGGLTYKAGATPGNGKLLAAGWYFANNGANAFVSLYQNLNAINPTRTNSIIIATSGTKADWILDNTFDAAGNIYVAGYTSGSLPNNTHLGEGDAFVIKYSPTLTNPIYKQFGTTKSDQIRKLEIGADGILYALGYTYGSYNGPNADATQKTGDVFVQKLDANLNLLESKQLGTAYEDRGFPFLKNNTLYVGGITEGSFIAPSNGSFDGFAFALNASDLTITTASILTTPVVVPPTTGNTPLEIKIYPNPTTNEIFIKGLNSVENYEVSVYNAAGQLVNTLSNITSINNKVNLLKLAQGVYFIKLTSLNSTHFFKVIKGNK